MEDLKALSKHTPIQSVEGVGCPQLVQSCCGAAALTVPGTHRPVQPSRPTEGSVQSIQVVCSHLLALKSSASSADLQSKMGVEEEVVVEEVFGGVEGREGLRCPAGGHMI